MYRRQVLREDVKRRTTTQCAIKVAYLHTWEKLSSIAGIIPEAEQFSKDFSHRAIPTVVWDLVSIEAYEGPLVDVEDTFIIGNVGQPTPIWSIQTFSLDERLKEVLRPAVANAQNLATIRAFRGIIGLGLRFTGCIPR